MKLIILTAVLAVCGAAKLEKRFILPGSARIGGSGLTGGSALIGGSVARPATSAIGLFGRVFTNDVPSGGYTNDAQGVVVDAVAPGTRTSGAEPTGLGGPRTAYGSVNSKVGEAAFEFGGASNKAPLFGLGAAGDGASRVGFGVDSATVKGGNVGGLGTGVSPGAASISTDDSGLGSAAIKGGNAGSLGIGVSPGDGSGFGSAALKGGNTGSFGIGVSPGAASISTDDSGLGSAAIKGGSAGSLGIGVSPGAGSISPDGSGLGSAAIKGGNAGSLGIGVPPGFGSISTDGSGFGSAALKGGSAGSLGIGVSPGAGPISPDGSGLGSAAIKGGNAGSLGIGVSPGFGSISTDGSGLGSAAIKGGNAGSLGIGVSPGDGSGFGSAALKGGNAGSFGIGVSPGASSISTDGLGFGTAAAKDKNAGTFGIGASSGAGSISTDGSGFGTAAVKGANAGSFGIGISPGAGSISTKDSSGIASAAVKGGNAGSFGFDVSPGAGSISTDGSGLGSAALKGGNAGGLGIGISSGADSISTDSSGIGSAALKGGNAGSFGIGASPGTASISADGIGFGSGSVKGGNVGAPGAGSFSTDGFGFGSTAVKGANLGGLGIGSTSGADSVHTRHEDDKDYALKFANSFASKSHSLETDSGISVGVKGVSDSPAVNNRNAGSLGAGVSPAVGRVPTEVSGFSSAASKGVNAGSFGVGVSQGASSISSGGSGFGSAALEGGNVGGLGIGATPGIDFVPTGHGGDKTYALKFANSFGLKKYSYGFETGNGISVGAKGVSTDGIKANGEYSYKGDDGKEYSVKYTADKNGYRPVGSHLPTPPPIPDEILESLKQNAKEEAAGIVDDGTYNVQKHKDEGDTSNNGETASIGGSLVNQAIKSNAAIQSTGSAGVQGSYGHTQGYGGQIFDNKNKFGSSQGEQEIVGQGLFGVKPQLGFQTTSSHESVLEKTESFGVKTNINVKPNNSGSTTSASASTGNQGLIGVPTLEGSFKGSSNDNSAYSSATVTSSGSASAFATTGNIDAASQPYLKLVDKRPKLPNQTSKDVSSSTSSAEVGTLGGSLQTNFPAQTSINTDSNSATVESSLSSATSSHNDDITQASISSFPSLLPSLSSNLGKLSSSQSQQSTKVSQSTNGQKVSVTGGAQSSIQQGTVYEYSKPTTSLSSEGHVISSQVNSETQTSQTLFGSQDTLNKPSQPQYSQKTFDSSQSGSKLQQSGVNSFQQNQGSIYEYNKPATSLTFSKDAKYSGVSQGTGSSFSQTQLGSTSVSQSGQKPQTSTLAFGLKPVDVSQTSTTFEKTQFGSSSGTLFNEKSKSSQSSSFASNDASKGNSAHTTLFGIKPGSSQTVESSSTQAHLGSTLGSPFNQKSQTTGTLSQTTTTFEQKPIGVSQTSSTFEKTQFSSLSSNGQSGQSTQFSLKPFGSTLSTGSSFPQTQIGSTSTSSTSEKTQFGSVSSSGTSKGHYGSTTQFGVKPFGSTLNTGSSFSQSKFGSTFGSQNDQKSQQGVGTISTTFPHVTPISQYGKQPFGVQSSFGSFQQSQHHSSTTGSKFVQQPQVTGTLFVQKPTGTSQTNFDYKNNQFGSLSSPSLSVKPQSTLGSSFSTSSASKDTSAQTGQFGVKPFGTLFNEKSQTSQGGSFSSSDTIKGQSGITTQFGVKPFGSTLNTGSSFSQTQFSNTSESQKDHKSQLGVGTVSTTFPHVTPISQYGKKPFGTQSTTFGSFQQTQHYAGQKPQTTGTLSQTSTTFGQKPVGISQTSATHDKTQFGSLTGTLFNEKSQTSHGGSFSSSDATKGQSGVTTQFGVKPFGSTLNTGSRFSQTQFSSTSESQKDHKSQLSVGTVSTTFPHVTPISQYGKKPFDTQSTTFGSFQQSQHYAGQKPQTTGTLSQTSTTFGQKPVGISQTSATHDKTQFGSLTGTLYNEKSQTNHGGAFSSSDEIKGQQSTQGSSLSSSGSSKGQPVLTTQFGSKPFGSKLITGSSSSQTQVDSTSGSLFGQKPQTTGLLSVSSTTSGQKPVGVSQSSSAFEKTQFGSSSGSLYNEKSHSSSFSSNDALKGQSELTTQFGVKPTLSTGYGFSQTQFGTASGAHNDKKSQFGFGTISTVTPQVVPISQYNKKPFGFQSTQSDFQQSQYSGSAGSQFGQNVQTGGSYSLFTIVGQKPTPLLGEKLQTTQDGSLSSTGTSKVQSDLTNKFGSATFDSSPSTGSSSTQTQFDSTLTSQSDKRPISSLSSQDLHQGSFGGIQTSQVSKYQTSQFSTSGVQPIGSILSQVLEQQKTQTSNQIGEQKPFGGFESSYQQYGIQKPAVIQISQPFEFKVQHSNNNNLYTVSSSSNSYPSSEIHVYREQNVQGVSEPSKVVSGSKTTFSKVEKKVNFQGPGEIFAGIREPPTFDIKTGYHY